MTADRVFVLVANRTDPSGDVPLDDLPGAGGRMDLVARFVNGALLTSHGVREDASAIVVFTRADPDPVAVRVRGAEAVGLRPDERSTAARLDKALDVAAMPVWQGVGDGLALRAAPLDELLEDLPDPLVVLHEDGTPLEAAELAGGTFVLGDQDGFTDEQRALLEQASAEELSVGPVALQADQVVAVVHNALDRAG